MILSPLRHQVIEVPQPLPQVTEYQLPRLVCGQCGLTTCGILPPGVPLGSYGPRLANLIARCSGAYRMSKRMVARFCTDGLGVPLALGEICHIEQMVAHALEQPVQEARVYVQTQDANVDETTWWEQVRRVTCWLRATRTQDSLDARLGSSRGGQPICSETEEHSPSAIF